MFSAVAQQRVDGVGHQLLLLQHRLHIRDSGGERQRHGGDGDGHSSAVGADHALAGIAKEAAGMSPGLATATERQAENAQAIAVHPELGVVGIDGLLHLGDGVRAQEGAVEGCLDERG